MYPVYEIDTEQAMHILTVQESFLNDIKAKEISRPSYLKPSLRSQTLQAAIFTLEYQKIKPRERELGMDLVIQKRPMT